MDTQTTRTQLEHSETRQDALAEALASESEARVKVEAELGLVRRELEGKPSEYVCCLRRTECLVTHCQIPCYPAHAGVFALFVLNTRPPVWCDSLTFPPNLALRCACHPLRLCLPFCLLACSDTEPLERVDFEALLQVR